ncbi:hypothetical protein L9F63_012116 [Diploptera punctata]|uniref:Uncharacterized protein n=1 Tax=Diploptera punctata TaxID=6984 RepID=A0AAD8EN37_DIPPU|nr:hypothetical protein L9F63_012116 [Diploptera punctata]
MNIMPEKGSRKSPARSSAIAAAAAISNATSEKANSVSPRKKSPARVSRRTERSPARITEKSPARRAEKSPARRPDKSPSRRTGRSPARRAEKSPSRATKKSSPARKKSPGRKPKSPTIPPSQNLSPHKEEIINNQPQVLVFPSHGRGDSFIIGDTKGGSRDVSTSSSSVLIRRSARVITKHEVKDNYEEPKGIEQLKVDELSDVEYPEKPAKLENEQVKEFGGTIGAYFLLTLLQVSLLAAHVYSSKAQYGIKDLKFLWIGKHILI